MKKKRIEEAEVGGKNEEEGLEVKDRMKGKWQREQRMMGQRVAWDNGSKDSRERSYK